MRIDIQEITDKRAVTRSDGGKINKLIKNNWEKQNKITIDFGNILVASVSFIDEAFGKLAFDYTKEELTTRLKFENIQKFDRALLNDILSSRLRQKELGENGPSRFTHKIGNKK